MRRVAIGRMLRMVRIRRDGRQRDIGQGAGLSAATIGRHEMGIIGSLDTLEQHAHALDLRVELRLVGRGGDLSRLADEEHAAIVEALALRLRGAGWRVASEVSFNEWGDRGRVDLAAFAAERGLVALIEVKTELVDLQETFGRLDVKERLALRIAAAQGWPARRAITALALAATDANRRVVAAHPALFAGFARRWLRKGWVPPDSPNGRILVWVPAQRANKRAWLAGRRRVRPVRRGRTVAPRATPQATPQAAPQAAPRAAPQAAPQATPQATPQAAPQATPQAAPQATPSDPRPRHAAESSTGDAYRTRRRQRSA
jgi:transcriptional regulator with XRE-family HTH domain